MKSEIRNPKPETPLFPRRGWLAVWNERRNSKIWRLECLALALFVLALGTAVVLIGCGRKQDAKTELEKAATELAREDTAQPAPAPAPPVQAEPAPVEVSAPAESPALPPATPAQQMQQALASYKTGELEDAVTRLQRLRTTPTLTAQQRLVIQDSVAAVMNEVYAMAAKGDARAIAAVKQYEKIQSAPRR